MHSTLMTRAHAQEVLDYIEAHPETHSQSKWFGESGCGTTMCVGGTSAFISSGYRMPDWSVQFEVVAGSNLGLNDDESDALFYNTLDKKDPEGTALGMLRAIAQGDVVEFNTVFATAADKVKDDEYNDLF